MKKTSLLIFTILFLVVSIRVSAQDRRNLNSFSSLSVAEGIRVILEKGNKESCVIHSDNIDLEDIITEVSGNRLKIHLDDNRRYRNVDVEIELTYVEITDINVSSGARISNQQPLKTSSLDISMSSGSHADLEIEVNSLDARLSSAADLDLKGSAANQDLNVSSAAKIDAYDLAGINVRASASSAGNISANASKEIRARASSAGNIRYTGDPERSDVHSSSGGSIHKR